MSTAGGKGASEYSTMMSKVFAEVARVLADEGLVTIVFHSAKAVVWQALTQAYSEAGLGVRATSVLDKVQATFKQVVSTTTVKGDPLILLDKQPRSQRPSTVEEIIASVLDEAVSRDSSDERTRERLFSRFITRCLIEGLPITVGANEFYAQADLHLGDIR